MKKPENARRTARTKSYDFSKGRRGKYAEAFAQGHNLVLLEPEIAAVFTSSQSVNDALRPLVHLIRQQQPASP